MLRLLHTADVHLGARHGDLGEQAAAQRERQFAAFRRSVDLAIEERVDLFLIAGDLFDSNTQPRRSVERVAAEHGACGVICGHVHHAAMHEHCGVIYINCGDWLESCTAVVERFDGTFEIKSWQADKCGRSSAMSVGELQEA